MCREMRGPMHRNRKRRLRTARMSLSTLLFLFFSSAGAFSPATSPRSRKYATSIIAPACHTSSSYIEVSPLTRKNDKSQPRLLSSLAMTAAQSTPSGTTATLTATKKFNCKKRTAILMAFLTGWADYIFIKKYNFFATMMTGNSMKMANAVIDGRIRDTIYFLSIISSYMFGVGIFRRAELSYKDKALHGLFAPIVAGCFLLTDYLSWVNSSYKLVPAMLLSFSWGIINQVGNDVTGTMVFVVTGAMTRVSYMIVDRISVTAGRKKIPREALLMSLSVIGGFILGAAWSVLLSVRAPQLMSQGVFSIIGVIYGLLFLWMDRRELGSWWLRKKSIA